MAAVNRSSRLWIYVVLVLLNLLVWGRTVQFDFVWDDHDFVARNESVRSLKNIPSMFLKSEAQGHNAEGARIFRPLRTAEYSVLYLAGGNAPRPWLFHAANILWHALATCLLFSVARRFLYLQSNTVGPASVIFAFLIAAAFAVHPVVSEVVCWVKSVDDIMAAVFVLAATRALLKTKSSTPLLAVGYFALAVYSKESAAPFALLAVFIFRAAHRLPWKQCFASSTWFLGVAIVYVVNRHFVIGQSVQSTPISGTYGQTLVDMLPVFAEYVRLAVGLPPFRIDYSYMGHNPFLSPDVLVGLFLLIATVAIGTWTWRSRSLWLTGFGLLWLGLFLLPVANVLPMMQYMAERFLYLPLIGGLLAVGAFLQKLPRQRYALTSAMLVVIAWIPLTLHRSTIWRDDLTLFTRSYQEGLKTPTIENNAVFALLHQPRIQQLLPIAEDSYQLTNTMTPPKIATAVEALNEIRKAYPDNENLLTVLGMVYLSNNRPKDAIPFFEATVRKNAKRPQWWLNLAMAHRVAEESAKARECFEKALDVDPEHRVAIKLYAVLCLELHDFETALLQLHKLQTIDERDPDLSNLIGQAESGLSPSERKMVEARQTFAKALQHNPTDAEAHAKLGHILVLQADRMSGEPRERKLSEAIIHHRAAIASKPDYGDPLNELAWILATEKSLLNTAEAIQMANRACESAQFRSPGFFDTLAVAYAANRQTNEAIATCQRALTLVSNDPPLAKVLRDRIVSLSSANQNIPIMAILPPKLPLAWDTLEQQATLTPGVESMEFVFWVTNTGKTEITVNQLSPSCNCTKPAKELPWKIAPGKSESLRITIDTRGKSGNVEMTVDVVSSVGTQTLTMRMDIPVPVAVLNPLTWDTFEKTIVPTFGDTKVEFTFWVTNTSSSAEITINRLVSSCDCTTALTPVPWKLGPGESGPMKAVVDIKAESGNLTRTINVMSSAGNQTLSMGINIPKL